jgi:tetratricopeptide (TPR) repeat protein
MTSNGPIESNGVALMSANPRFAGCGGSFDEVRFGVKKGARWLIALSLLACMVSTSTVHVEAGNFDVKALLHDASTVAATVSDLELFEKVAVLREVARAQAAAGDRDVSGASVEIAFRTLAQRSTTDAYRANAVVELAEASAGGNPVELEHLLKRAAAISPNLMLHRDHGYALRNLAEAFARSGSPGAAITRAKGIADGNWRQAALHAIADIEADARSRPWVEQSVAAARLPIDRARILVSVAKRWAGSGDVPAARWAIAEALRMVQDVRITKWPDVLAAIAEAQVTAGDLEGAHRVATRIVGAGDDWYIVEVLTVLGIARARAGDKAGALESLQRSREAALRLPAEARLKPGSPRGEALAKVAAAYAQIGEADTASAVARNIPKVAPGREYLAAEALLSVARFQAGATAFASLSRAEAHMGNLIGALKAAEAIPDDRSRIITLAGLAPLQAKVGDVAGARETARKVLDDSRQAYALQAVAWDARVAVISRAL